MPGAAPVLIGWAAVTGSLDWPPLVFFGVVFCWQMPHFWALAMRFRDDYARAGVPMLPVVAPGAVGRPADRRLGLADRRGVAAAVAGRRRTTASAGSTRPRPRRWARGSSLEAHRLLGRIRREADTKPMQLFHVSISYLALLSIAIIVDVLI